MWGGSSWLDPNDLKLAHTPIKLYAYTILSFTFLTKVHILFLELYGLATLDEMHEFVRNIKGERSEREKKIN